MRLDGVHVLDLTRLLPGPYATQLLADAGADVVKIEDTESGDYARFMPPITDHGIGAVFDGVNRGKRSVAIDLKSEAGRSVLYDLMPEADVVVEGFRPGVTARLGVDYETVTEHREDVVYCSLTGYGQDGPLADRAGHDINYVGLAGFLDMNRRDVEAVPTLPGYPVADMAGGMFAAFAICSALLSRELGNAGGEYLDVSLTDAVVSFSQALAPQALRDGNPRPGQTPLTGAYPWYDVYETADGRYVTLGALEHQFWRAFCDVVDRPDLVGYHMTEDPDERAALREQLEDLFASRTRDEWIETTREADATVEGVYTPSEALEHPQVSARGFVERSTHDSPRVGSPLVGPEIPEGSAGDAPGHGEHTDEVLREVGYDEAEVDRLREAGVIN